MNLLQAIYKAAFGFDVIYKKPKYLITNKVTLDQIKIEMNPIFIQLGSDLIEQRNELFGLKIVLLESPQQKFQYNHWEIGYEP